jgi:hypothetical protein
MIKTAKYKDGKILVNGSVLVPIDENNRHYKEIQKWVKEGNVIEPEYTLEELKQFKKQEIEKSYEEALQQPITYNINGTDYTFQADEKSQDILNKVIVAAPDNFVTNWLDINNNFVQMTLKDLKGLAQAILNRGQQLFLKKVQLKQQINNASTEKELSKISWESGTNAS